MVVEVWDGQGPRCYLDVPHPMPRYLARLVDAKCYYPLENDSSAAAEVFALTPLVNHALRTMHPVYVKLNEQGVPCHT